MGCIKNVEHLFTTRILRYLTIDYENRKKKIPFKYNRQFGTIPTLNI